MMYGLDDICLIPARISKVEHRSDCNPYNYDGVLPLFTAPMNSVINGDNYQVFMDNKINTIIPRGVDFTKRLELASKTFVAVGLDEFEKLTNMLDFDNSDSCYYICIDVANGHMQKLIDLCSEAKSKYGGRLIIMTGNIANPDTYVDYAIAGIDFVRLSVGQGASCVTSSRLGIHYGAASLIKECVDKKWEIEQTLNEIKKLNRKEDFPINCPYKSIPFIIADGGYNSYDRIIKALALGADYVMIGKLFAQCEEACGEYYTNDNKKYRKYYGMSTERAQIENGNSKIKTSEGISFDIEINNTLPEWCNEFKSYLTSAMSYTNSFNLDEFKNTEYKIVSSLERLAYYK